MARSDLPALHVCTGSPDPHERNLARLAEHGTTSDWTVDRSVVRGDRLLFYLSAPISALVAEATAISDAKRATRGVWSGYYMARINQVRMLSSRPDIRTLRKRFRLWGWLQRPARAASIPDEVSFRLREMLRLGVGPIVASLMDVDADAVQNSRPEGRRRLVTHLKRERDPNIVARKKRSILAAGERLKCEACGFDFEREYGRLGKEYCEVHHAVALRALKAPRATKLSELRIVCSNCHRMIHRETPMLTIIAVRRRMRHAKLLNSQSKKVAVRRKFS